MLTCKSEAVVKEQFKINDVPESGKYNFTKVSLELVDIIQYSRTIYGDHENWGSLAPNIIPQPA